jgi:hypothetical protein
MQRLHGRNPPERRGGHRDKSGHFYAARGGRGRTAAENTGRLHGKDKLIVSERIAGQHGLPAILIGSKGWFFIIGSSYKHT